jgi:hypothetical protein
VTLAGVLNLATPSVKASNSHSLSLGV